MNCQFLSERAADINALKRQLKTDLFKKAYVLNLSQLIPKLINNL